MSIAIIGLVVIVFITVLALTFVASRRFESSKVGPRVAAYIKLSATTDGLAERLSASGRENSSGFGRLVSYAAVTAPRKLRETVATDLVQARVSMTPAKFLGIRGVLLIGTALVVALWILVAQPKTVVEWMIAGGIVLVGGRLPGMWLKRRIKANKRAIERALPYALDLLVACLEGGLSLEASLNKVASEDDSILSQEIRRTLAEITLGRPRSEERRVGR